MDEIQSSAFELALAGASFFLTGSAGTGKSYTLREIISVLRNRHGSDHVFVTASTGVAACNIGGTTLHWFAGVGLGKGDGFQLYHKLSRNKRNKEAFERWKKCKVLVVDEISMLDAAFFDSLEHVARLVKKSALPFGGIQVILCGDFLQLPPVGDKAQFCFKATSWPRVVTETILLEKVWRQDNPEYLALLQAARVAQLGADHETTLQKRKNATLNNPVRLFAWRDAADRLNLQRLRQLDGTEQVFDSKDDGDLKLVEGCMAPQKLQLKVGASVMLIRNLNVMAGLCNGALGVVDGFAKEGVLVQFQNPKALLTVTPSVWEIKSGNRVVATRSQIPLILAWGITIHKSQGLSIPCLQVDLRTFGPAQAYVALSRGCTLDGLSVTNYYPGNIKADGEALQFYRELERAPASKRLKVEEKE